MRRIIIALLVLSSIPVTAGPAAACSCAISTPEEHAQSAKVIFTGRVKSIEKAQTQNLVRFRVTKVYKGPVACRVEVVTASDSAACGCWFKDGVRYTVFGSRRGEPIPTNLCSGTKRGSIDPSDYGLPPGSPP